MIQLALFDWNGTIFDDMPAFWGAVSETFRHFGQEPPPIDKYFWALEGDYVSAYRAWGIEQSREALNAIYEPTYWELMRNARPFPDAVSTLEALQERGIVAGLVTSQKGDLVTPLLEQFGLSKFFDYSRFHALNKRESIEEICMQAGEQRQECAYVGDAPSDIKSGRGAGVHTVAFRNAYVPDDLIDYVGPDFSIHHLSELPALIDRLV